MQWKVLSDHKAIYPDPISVKQDERNTLSGREDVWNRHRWLWALAADGREGWVPDDFPITVSGTATRCAYEYSATEISVVSGELVTGTVERNGWLWSQNKEGANGWVTIRCLTRENKSLPK